MLSVKLSDILKMSMNFKVCFARVREIFNKASLVSTQNKLTAENFKINKSSLDVLMQSLFCDALRTGYKRVFHLLRI